MSFFLAEEIKLPLSNLLFEALSKIITDKIGILWLFKSKVVIRKLSHGTKTDRQKGLAQTNIVGVIVGLINDLQSRKLSTFDKEKVFLAVIHSHKVEDINLRTRGTLNYLSNKDKKKFLKLVFFQYFITYQNQKRRSRHSYINSSL